MQMCTLNKLKNGKIDGYFLNPKTWGTYIHGIFDNQLIISYIVMTNSNIELSSDINYSNFKEEQYDKLAQHIRKHVDIESIYERLAL